MTGRPKSVSDGEIFRAVAEVLSAAGPAGLTLAAVAGRAGLSAPALAQRFGSKRGLLVAFAAAEADSPARLFAAARAKAQDPVAAIRAALTAFAEPLATPEAFAHGLAFLGLDLADPELRAHAAAQAGALRAELTALVEEAADVGDLAVADPAELAETLHVVYSGALLTWPMSAEPSLAAWLARHLDRALAPHLA